MDELAASEYQALAAFRYQLRRFLRFSEERAEAAGLEPRHHQLLLAIKGLPPGQQPTVGALAEQLQIQHHSAVELIDRAERRGLIQRVRGAADRRQVFARLTPRGEAMLDDLSRYHRAELRSTGPALIQALNALLASTESAEEDRAASDDGMRPHHVEGECLA